MATAKKAVKAAPPAIKGKNAPKKSSAKRASKSSSKSAIVTQAGLVGGLGQVAANIGDSIVNFLGEVPASVLPKSADPYEDARALTSRAAAKASLAAGVLALPPGPIGWLTILPEMLAVWKIQAQLVADIAALYGKKARLSQEQMLFCLFRHTAAQAVRDLLVRVGERLVVKRATLQVLQRIARAIGVKIAQRTLSKGLARWLPVVGAVGVAGYAYYDTAQVGATAIDLFSGNLAKRTQSPD